MAKTESGTEIEIDIFLWNNCELTEEESVGLICYERKYKVTMEFQSIAKSITWKMMKQKNAPFALIWANCEYCTI